MEQLETMSSADLKVSIEFTIIICINKIKICLNKMLLRLLSCIYNKNNKVINCIKL